MTGRIERGPAILRYVRQHDHIPRVWRETPVADQVLTNVIGVIDAPVQLVIGADVVDTDQKGLLTGHFDTRMEWIVDRKLSKTQGGRTQVQEPAHLVVLEAMGSRDAGS